ncbi:MAG: SRPBCC family protein [Litorimonas sp.]
MTMNSETLSEAKGRLVFRRYLSRPPKTVWRFLVEDQKRGEWLCRGLVEPQAGGRIEFKFDPENFGRPRPPGTSPTAYTADFEGQVITYDPEHTLAFTWPSAGDLEDSLITITLTPKGDGTALKLVHERVVRESDMVGSAAGWHAHLELLECRLSRQLAPNFFERHDTLEAEYERRLAELRNKEPNA